MNNDIQAEMVELRFFGPASKASLAVKTLGSIGFASTHIEKPQSLSDLQTPGQLLVSARYGLSLTQKQLSHQSGIPRRHISEMENGKRPIGKENAKRLARSLNIDYRFFL